MAGCNRPCRRTLLYTGRMTLCCWPRLLTKATRGLSCMSRRSSMRTVCRYGSRCALGSDEAAMRFRPLPLEGEGREGGRPATPPEWPRSLRRCLLAPRYSRTAPLDSHALRANASVTRLPFRAPGLAALHLDDQLRRRAKEVDDVRSDRLLTTEAKAIKL